MAEVSKKRKKRGHRCIVYGCSNTTLDGVTLFGFPQDPDLAKRWQTQVRKTRVWDGSSGEICSSHFTEDCFESSSLFKKKFVSPKTRLILKRDSVPTIIERPGASFQSTSQPGVSDSLVSGPACKKTKVGGAYVKRERARQMNQILEDDRSAHCDGPSQTSQEPDTSENVWIMDTCAVASQTSSKDLMKGYVRNKGTMAHLRPRSKNASCQTKMECPHCHRGLRAPGPEVASVGVQCDLSQPEVEDVVEEVVEDGETKEAEDDSDLDYIPSKSSNSTPINTDDEQSDTTSQTSRDSLYTDIKFMVFWSSLLQLLRWCHCPACGGVELSFEKKFVGTMLVLSIKCGGCQGKVAWNSQPYAGNIPAGNILLSAAILFSGTSISKSLRMFRHMNMACISSRTFFRHQQSLLQPAVMDVWTREREELVCVLLAEGVKLVLAGDGRADSPGHCAKYGTYTLIEIASNNILEVQLVQSNECGGSSQMELEGLIRGIDCLKEEGLTIGTIITDRHRQIGKWIRLNLKEVQHYFDIWHVAKGVSRKVEKVAQDRECFDVTPWTKSIVNHLYWSAISSELGDGQMIVAKWKSILSHVVNIHSGHGELYASCNHGTLEGRESKKKWLKPSSKSSTKLEKVVNNPTLLTDIAKLSGHHQTSCVEAFHSLTNQFAPKTNVYSYHSMNARTLLAALHYNENSKRPQQETKDGNPQYKVRYPKYKKGGYIVCKVSSEPTFKYVDRLMVAVLGKCTGQEPQPFRNWEREGTPPPLCAKYDHPAKHDAIQQHKTRF